MHGASSPSAWGSLAPTCSLSCHAPSVLSPPSSLITLPQYPSFPLSSSSESQASPLLPLSPSFSLLFPPPSPPFFPSSSILMRGCVRTYPASPPGPILSPASHSSDHASFCACSFKLLWRLLGPILRRLHCSFYLYVRPDSASALHTIVPSQYRPRPTGTPAWRVLHLYCEGLIIGSS